MLKGVLATFVHSVGCSCFGIFHFLLICMIDENFMWYFYYKIPQVLPITISSECVYAFMKWVCMSVFIRRQNKHGTGSKYSDVSDGDSDGDDVEDGSSDDFISDGSAIRKKVKGKKARKGDDISKKGRGKRRKKIKQISSSNSEHSVSVCRQ